MAGEFENEGGGGRGESEGWVVEVLEHAGGGGGAPVLDGVDGLVVGCEEDEPAEDGFGEREEAEGGFGDDAEGAFAAAGAKGEPDGQRSPFLR